MMKVVISAATKQEIEPVMHYDYHKNTGLEVQFHVSGVGLLSTAVSLTKLFVKEKPDLIIQAGIAGAFDQSISLEKLITVKEEFLGDLGVQEGNEWKDLFDLQLEDANRFPFKNKTLANPWLSKFNLLQLPELNGVSVNEITTNQARREKLIEKYDVQAESMEGAALHYVCLEWNTAFIQIKAISNYVGERDKNNWKMKTAIQNLNEGLMNYLEKLKDLCDVSHSS